MAEATFLGLPFRTAPGRVMTPRPATERLVAAAAERIGGLGTARVADVGTGAGAIAVSLARIVPNAEIWASDVSAAAVSVARENARRHGVADRVHVVGGDLLEPLPGELDLVVANLPYLPACDRRRYPDLASEPADALFAGGDGLGLYRRLFCSAGERLRDGGAVIVQLHRRALTFERSELGAAGLMLTELVPAAGRGLRPRVGVPNPALA